MYHKVKFTLRCIPTLIPLVSSSYTMTMLFSYLPWMVQFLIPGLSDKDIGYYVGLIASSQFLGRFFGSYIWGWIGDKYGRRFVLIWSGIILGFCSLLYGFSTNIAAAIFFRFLCGFFNGIVPCAKASLYELSDVSTRALAMSLIGVNFTVGLVLGPGISGLLADPISQYDIQASVWLLAKFPYVLPSLANTLILWGAVVIVYFYFKETYLLQKINTEDCTRSEGTQQLHSLADPEIAHSSSEEEIDEKPTLRKKNNTSIRCVANPISAFRNSTLANLLSDRVVIINMMLYFAISFASISTDEVIPVWCKEPLSVGGLELSIHDISLIFVMSAVFAFPFQFFTFQILDWLVGTHNSYHITTIVMIPVLLFLPLLPLASDHPLIIQCLFCLLLVLYRVGLAVLYAAQSLLLNLSVTPDKLGSVNGLAVSCASIARTLAPLVAGSLFSLSLKNEHFPFDYHLIFIVNTVAFLSCVFITTMIPKYKLLKRKNSTI